MRQDHPMTPGELAPDKGTPNAAALTAVGHPDLVRDYVSLELALNVAYQQASMGKGAERHANALPFHEQPMQTTAKLHGIGFITGQVTKKLAEAQGMLARGDTDAALREIAGAIVYSAGAYVYATAEHNKKIEE